MATVQTQIRIDEDVKREVTALFTELGTDMSGAVNMFLRQCLLHRGLPFSVELPPLELPPEKSEKVSKRVKKLQVKK